MTAVIWSAASGACFMLAAMYLLVWLPGSGVWRVASGSCRHGGSVREWNIQSGRTWILTGREGDPKFLMVRDTGPRIPVGMVDLPFGRFALTMNGCRGPISRGILERFGGTLKSVNGAG